MPPRSRTRELWDCEGALPLILSSCCQCDSLCPLHSDSRAFEETRAGLLHAVSLACAISAVVCFRRAFAVGRGIIRTLVWATQIQGPIGCASGNFARLTLADRPTVASESSILRHQQDADQQQNRSQLSQKPRNHRIDPVHNDLPFQGNQANGFSKSKCRKRAASHTRPACTIFLSCATSRFSRYILEGERR